MCKTRKDALAAAPTRKPQPSAPSSADPFGDAMPPSSSPSPLVSTSFPTTTSDAGAHTDGRDPPGSSSSKPTYSSASSSGVVSIPGLREILPAPPNLYDFSEICSATNNFLGKRLSSSSTSNSWRCVLRGRDAVVFQRRFHGDPVGLRRHLAASSKIHHNSIVRLLGAAVGGDYVYIASEHVPGASLADCLRNPMNPGYTPLAAWVDRMQVATDLAQGLQYIHHFTSRRIAAPPSTTPHKSDSYGGVSRRRPVHNRIKSSSIMITETQHRAKICHFGAAQLAGEISVSSDSEEDQTDSKNGTREEDDGILQFGESPSARLPSKLPASGSRRQRFEGTRGYIAPEVRHGESPTQKSDVFAFGVVLLELLTGEEPLKYKYDGQRKAFERVSLIETAKDVMICEEDAAEGDEGEADAGREAMLAGERHRRLRRWMDRRLNDSFPVEVAERVAALALECVREEAERRPDMVRVAGKLSRLLLKSRVWVEKLAVSADITVSVAPR